MSTVLWANVLSAGRVKSDQADHLALYKHAEKLDASRNHSICPRHVDLRHDDQEISMASASSPPAWRRETSSWPCRAHGCRWRTRSRF